MESLIFLGLAILIVVILVMAGVKVVPQSETRVIERLGRFHSVLPPGLNIIWPFIDKPKTPASDKQVKQAMAIMAEADELEKVGNIMEIVTADEDTRTLAHTDVHLRHLRFAVSAGIGLVEECHHVDTIFTGSKKELEQVVARSIGIGDAGESLGHESSD